MGRTTGWTMAALLFTGCVRYPGPIDHLGEPLPMPSAEGSVPRPRRRAAAASAFQDALLRAVDYYLVHRPDRDDCSGFVEAVFRRAGLPLSGSTASLYEALRPTVHRHRRPKIGDLAFFDDTYDRNGNGRLDDSLSHVGVVIDVDEDGTITIAHGGTSRGRTTLVMNLLAPTTRADASGRVLNEALRARHDGDPRSTKYLASELWRAFAAPPVGRR